MPTSLDIHIASADEQRAAHANCHDVWSLGLPLDKHVARREASALHRRARWIVGCLDSRVVCALASHGIVLRVGGESVPGIAIASVHTLGEFRGRGFARQLLAWIEAFERREGARASMLFCDIDPAYYARFGYSLCPSHMGWTERATTGPRESGKGPNAARLVPVTTDRELRLMYDLYDSDHGRRPLAVERPVDYWQHLAARFPTSEWFALAAGSGKPRAYVRAHQVGNDLVILDHAVSGGDEQLRIELWGQAIRLAARQGRTRVGGWLPDTPSARSLFRIERRRDEITMIKPLDARVAIDPSMVEAAAWVQEIDHV